SVGRCGLRNGACGAFDRLDLRGRCRVDSCAASECVFRRTGAGYLFTCRQGASVCGSGRGPCGLDRYLDQAMMLRGARVASGAAEAAMADVGISRGLLKMEGSAGGPVRFP